MNKGVEINDGSISFPNFNVLMLHGHTCLLSRQSKPFRSYASLISIIGRESMTNAHHFAAATNHAGFIKESKMKKKLNTIPTWKYSQITIIHEKNHKIPVQQQQLNVAFKNPSLIHIGWKILTLKNPINMNKWTSTINWI